MTSFRILDWFAIEAPAATLASKLNDGSCSLSRFSTEMRIFLDTQEPQRVRVPPFT
jgi:hypothetical protein